MGFWDDRHGLAMSDPVDGKFRVLSDPQRRPVLVGRRPEPACRRLWTASSASRRAGPAWSPPVQPGRLDRHRRRGADPGAAHPRPRAHLEGGHHADARAAPLAPASSRWPSAARQDLLAVGGDFTRAGRRRELSARSWDGGRRFWPGGDLGGYRSGSAWLPRTRGVRRGRRADRFGRLARTAAGTGRRSTPAAWTAWTARRTARAGAPATPAGSPCCAASATTTRTANGGSEPARPRQRAARAGCAGLSGRRAPRRRAARVAPPRPPQPAHPPSPR